MSDRANLVYICDGSLEGIFCCVFESYVRREVPADILPDGELTLFPVRQIICDEAKALRIHRSLERISAEVLEWAQTAYLSCVDGRELLIYQFIALAYRYGAKVTSMLADPVVSGVFKAVRAVRNEAHLLIEFLRFSDFGGALVAEIEPKALVLPYLKTHFAGRFPDETFFIFDLTHGLALLYRPYEAAIQPIDGFELPQASGEERAFRSLWKRYYDTIAIEGRYNPKCRMTHMPKHFWKHMTEFSDEFSLPGEARENRLPPFSTLPSPRRCIGSDLPHDQHHGA